MKLFFDGTLISMSFSAFLFGFTLIFYYVLVNRPIITAGKFPDETQEQDIVNLEKWFNTYKHPLAMSNHIRSVPKLTQRAQQTSNPTADETPDLDFGEQWFREVVLKKLENKERKAHFLTGTELEELYEEVTFRRVEQEQARKKHSKLRLIRQPLSRHE